MVSCCLTRLGVKGGLAPRSACSPPKQTAAGLRGGSFEGLPDKRRVPAVPWATAWAQPREERGAV